MTDSQRALDAIANAAAQLVPELSRRLEEHGLGEIEVAHGDLRLRVTSTARAAAATPGRSAAADPVGEPGPAQSAFPTPEPAAPGADAAGGALEAGGIGVASPAVGFFVYADGLGPGLTVDKGDPLGHVEVLGVRHDVRAPRRGTVRHLVAESGEAVEYGQVVVELEPAGAAR